MVFSHGKGNNARNTNRLYTQYQNIMQKGEYSMKKILTITRWENYLAISLSGTRELNSHTKGVGGSGYEGGVYVYTTLDNPPAVG